MTAREPIVLTQRLNLPARDARSVRAACNPRLELMGPDLVALREDLSTARGGNRVQRLEECIRGELRGDYQVNLLSGHPGSGKSTELRWLAGELQKDKDGVGFHTLFVDVQDYLDARDVQLPEFITAIFSAIVDDEILGQYARLSVSAKKIWGDIREWVKGIGLGVDAEIPAGAAKLKASFKTSPGFQKRYREVGRDRIASLMQLLSDVITDVRSALIKQGVQDLVIIADNLERIERLPLDDGTKRTTHDLFFLEQLPLIQEIPVHFIVSVPVSLHFTQGRLRHAFRSPNDVVLPMIAVHPRGVANKLDQAGAAALEKLLRRRIDCDVVFADKAALEHAIGQSGGCIRDLLRIVAQATLMKPELALTTADIDRVIGEFVGNYERLLQGRAFLPELHHVATTGSFPVAFDDDTRQWLLYELVVLEYNGETWYDVHPFARRTRAFREAAPKPAMS